MRTSASVLFLLAVLAGCGGTGSVPAEDVAQQASAELAEQVGREPDDVECPGPLKAEVGATLRCTLTDGGTSYGVAVEVTEVEGSDVRFAVEVDQTPQ